jgi:succinate dehydrogenase cytochrome b subunit
VATTEASLMQAAETAREDRTDWVLRRLHSVSGIIPIGAFLFFHIFENSYVVRGANLWWSESAFTRQLPFQMFIEATVLWIPIAYHGIYGIVITATSQPNTYPYMRNYRYTMQRVTGVLALLFIGFHVFTTRAWFYMTGIETNYARMHAFMMNPIILTIYVVGTLSCIYHLCNGIFTFCITWGLSNGPRSQQLVTYACAAIFIVMSIAAMWTLVAFRAPA